MLRVRVREHTAYVAESAWRHMKPKRPVLPPADRIRLGGGIILAAVLGVFVTGASPSGMVLVNVGSFFGALLVLLPHHHGRVASVIAGVVLVDGGSALGILLAGQPLVALLILFVGLFIAGMARAISVGAFMRLLFAAIAVCSVGELSRAAAHPSEAWLSLAAFAFGQIVVAICGCIGTNRRRFGAQRDAIAELYRQLIALAQGYEAHYVLARMRARELVEVIPTLEFADTRWIRRLVDLSDTIAADVSTSPRADDVQALEWVVEHVIGGEPAPLARNLDLTTDVAAAVSVLSTGPQPGHLPRLRAMTPTFTLRFLLGELRDTRGSTFRFALRVAITGVVCQAVGEFVFEGFGGLPLHGFWVLLAGCLVAMPDYHDTSGRAIARTAGSVIGAVLGTALSLIPVLQQEPFFIIVCTLLVIAYLAARTVSQGMLMVVVVGWIAFMLGGEAAAFTRTFDTVIGAAIAAAVFFLLPTWNVDRLLVLLQRWCSYGRVALTTSFAADRDPSGAVQPLERVAFTNLYHAQHRFAYAAAAVPREPRQNESPWPVDTLPSIADSMDRVAIALLRARRMPQVSEADRAAVAACAEWFGAIGERLPLPTPAPAPDDNRLRMLGDSLAQLGDQTGPPVSA